MVTFPSGGMSDGNGSVRPSEDVHLPPSTGDAPRFKVRKVSVNRQFPWMCGLEYQYFGVEPEETAVVSGGESVPLNSNSNDGAMTGSGLQNQVGTSTGMVVQENAGSPVKNLFLEARENLGMKANASKKLVSSEGWDNMFNGNATPVVDQDVADFKMKIGVKAQSHEVVGSPVEEEGNESVDVMVESAVKGVDTELPEEVLPSVEKLVQGEVEALAKKTDVDGGRKRNSEGGFVIHEEGSAPCLKKTLPVRKVSVKRDFPKYCGLNAIAPPAEEYQNDGIESMDTRNGDNVVGSGPEDDWKQPGVASVSGGSKGGSSGCPIKPDWRGKFVAKKTVSNANAQNQRVLLKNMAASSTKQPADTPSGKVLRDDGKNSKDEAPRGKGKRSSLIDFEVAVPNSGASSSNGDARSKVKDVLRTYQAVCRKLLQGEEARFEEGSKSKDKIKRIDLEADKILKERGKEVNTEHHHFIGSVPGVEVGDEFYYRVELAIIGIHRVYQGGIDFATVSGQKIAVSIVASGGYDDDLGDPNVLIYSGQGGNPGRGKQREDQKLERGNLALWNSKKVKNPVRVVRGTKENDKDKSKIVTKYVYDGLYTVEECRKETGEHGKLVYMFKLRRNQNQKEVAWNEIKASKTTARVTRSGVCVDDISQKKELVPISVVNTVDDEKPPAFNYTKKVMYPKSLCKQSGKGCSCSDRCSDSRKCSCAGKNGGMIPYNRNGAIVETKALVYECGPQCKCPPSCYNRVSQSGIKLPLEVFKTDTRGWGVRALTSISSGSFICEYTGEVLDEEETKKRTNDDYMFDLDLGEMHSDTETGEKYTIDALRFGNVGRFVNHSCSPNLFSQNIMYDHDDKRASHIMLFAAEHIPALQELTYDYNYDSTQLRDSNGNVEVKECRCGATGCSGRLY